MINWQFFPKCNDAPQMLKEVVSCFERIELEISSEQNSLTSNQVLERIRPHLQEIGFIVETGNKAQQKIRVPVLFGLNGNPEKSFEVDAYHQVSKTVIEIEAGRAVTNYQFLKDFFEACVMFNVEYLVLVIRRIYRNSRDFGKIVTFFETLFASGRMAIPLKGILVIGY